MIDKRLIDPVRWKLLLSGVASLLLGSLSAAQAATINAASCNYSDVLSAYNSANSGDTVAIPAGNVTWSAGLSISKSVTIQGAGSTKTIINKSGSFTVFTVSGMGADVPVRITGLRINASVGQNGTNSAVSTLGPQNSSFSFTKIRIDNCFFYGGQQVIFWEYRAIGVVDHCTFHNCAYATQVYGMFDLDWNRYSAPNPALKYGTADAVFFEDNTFIYDNAITYFDCLSDCFEGGRLVFRHNTFDLSQYTSAGEFGSLITGHGNEAYWTRNANNDNFRAALMHEIYNNTFKIYQCYRVIWPRGGRLLVANNTFTVTVGSIGSMVALSEEEDWPSRGPSGVDWFNPLRTAWPAEDQVNNAFIFGNTVNGSPQSDSMITGWDATDTTSIQKGRDWWDVPPSSTTKTIYPNPGSPSLANYPNPYNPAVTSWTAFTYPHPLVSGSTGGSTGGTSNSSDPNLFSASDTPAIMTVNDPNPVELGVKFQTSTSSQITGFRFYKGQQNTGTHVAHLWSSAGALLASATFTNETASGWQQVNLSSPVTLTAGTTYVVSYHTNGFYSANGSYFTTAHTSGPLTAPATSASGGNGVYAYGSSGSFPRNTYNANNYWIDVVFKQL
jgi:Domain of unknown function (DUF4082)